MAYREDRYPGSPMAGPSIAIPFEAGRELRTAFTLTPIRGVCVRGSISGLPGGASSGASPGPQASVVLVRSGNGISPNLSALTRPDGSFDIGSVPPGSYVARAN